MRTETEIRESNPAGRRTCPAKAGSQPVANIASSSEMAARSVWSESKSRVIESRNYSHRWSLSVLNQGGSTEAPKQMPGVEVRPGSKSGADGWEGLPGNLGDPSLSLCEREPEQGRTGLTTSWHAGGSPVTGMSERAGQQRVSPSERNERGEMGSGSRSVLVVARESRRTTPREPVNSEGGHRSTEPSLGNMR